MRKLFTILAGLLLCHAAYAAQLFGKVDAVTGSATMSDKAGGTYNVRRGQQVFEGYTINTASNGEIHIATVDGGFIALRSNTSFRVDEYKANGGTSDKIYMSLFKGAARSITGWIGKRNAANYRIITPTATIGIRGTDHETIVIDKAGKKADGEEPGTYDTVKDGSTVLKTPQGEAEVRPGKFVFAPKDRAVAPILLANAPKFFVARRLKIEGRVESRKVFLQKHMDQMRDERVKQVQSMPAGADGQDDGTHQIGEEVLDDPTKPGNQKEEVAPKPVLQAVYLAPGRAAAVINGREVKLGEKFGEATLIKVQDSEVTLRNADGELEILKMHPGIEKTPAKTGN